MGRRFQLLLSALSLLLSLLIAVLWAQSKGEIGMIRRDEVLFSDAGRFWMLISRGGQLLLETTPDWKHETAESAAVFGDLSWDQRPWGCMDFYGFCLLHGTTYVGLYRRGDPYPLGAPFRTTGWQFGMPHWFVLLVVGSPLMLALLGLSSDVRHGGRWTVAAGIWVLIAAVVGGSYAVRLWRLVQEIRHSPPWAFGFANVPQLLSELQRRMYWETAFAATAAILACGCFRRAWRRRVRAYRQINRLCGQCGYSLIGNASGICPECGSAVRLTPCRPD